MSSDLAEDTKVKTAVPPHGHWRNKFWSADGWTKCDPGAIHLDKNTCILREQFLSEAEAQRGASILMHEAEDPADAWYDPKSVLIYLGAVFFQER